MDIFDTSNYTNIHATGTVLCDTLSYNTTNAALKFRTAYIALTSAQLKALRATYIKVLDAPDSSEFYLLKNVIYKYNFLTAAYTGNGNISLVLDNPAAATLGSSTANTVFMTGTGNLICTMATPTVLSAIDPESIKGKALYIANTGAAEFATGAGTLEVQIEYVTVTV